jgi:hypothetical protein
MSAARTTRAHTRSAKDKRRSRGKSRSGNRDNGYGHRDTGLAASMTAAGCWNRAETGHANNGAHTRAHKHCPRDNRHSRTRDDEHSRSDTGLAASMTMVTAGSRGRTGIRRENSRAHAQSRQSRKKRCPRSSGERRDAAPASPSA